MNSSATLFGEIFEITRGDLENACFPYIRPVEYLRSTVPIRLTRLSQFWKQAGSNEVAILHQSVEDFVAGLFGQSCPWLFFLSGQQTEIQCWFASDPNVLDSASLASLLRGSLPDARVSLAEFDYRSLESLKYGLVLTGTPSLKAEGDGRPAGDQLEKLCRGLFGSNWLYLVSSEPVEATETTRSINELSEKVKNVRATYLLKASPIDEENRTAQRYVELLEAKLKRLDRGRTSGMWRVRCSLYTDQATLLPRARHCLQAAFSGEDSVPDPVRVRPCSSQAGHDPGMEPLTSSEIAALTRPPKEDFPGYQVVEYARFGVEPSRFVDKSSIAVGEIADRGVKTGNWLRISREDLTKHGLVTGITGSGKTNSCFWLLDQVWNAGSGVPFLVVEAAKSEYRALMANPRFRDLRVFTVGDDTASPLRLNPFEVPPGILVQTHIDYIKSLFSAAFVLYPPMPYVLEQSVQEIYEDRGWNVALNTNSRGSESDRSYPTLADLAAKVSVVVDRMGYEQRITMDVKAGLLARINQLRLGGGKGLMLNTRRSVSESVLFESPCLLELKQIVSDDEKAFIIGLVLIRLYEYHEARQRQGQGLVHLTLIEEAHRLLRNVSMEQGSDSANPKGRAIEVFASILSEIRAYGEGILVAEQIPVKLAPDVIKNTGFKLIHRLVSSDDRELVGNTLNLDEVQIRYLATLKTGEAVAWTERTHKAVLLQVPSFPGKDSQPVSLETMRRLHTKGPSLLPYPGCASCEEPGDGGCTGRRQQTFDEALLDAFHRVFNAMRLYHPATIPAFAEFRQLIYRDARTNTHTKPYCSFVQIAEADIERRSEFRAWQYTDVEGVMSSACAAALDISTSLNGSQVADLPDGALAAMATLQERCGRLESVENLPFPGCRFCEVPCYYRFDMNQASRIFGKEFRWAFLDRSTKTERLVQIARSAAAKSFSISDLRSTAGASFCFAVQQLAENELGLSMYFQHETAAMLKDRLAAGT
jgi:DNA helicase HerA-like ATPase